MKHIWELNEFDAFVNTLESMSQDAQEQAHGGDTTAYGLLQDLFYYLSAYYGHKGIATKLRLNGNVEMADQQESLADEVARDGLPVMIEAFLGGK